MDTAGPQAVAWDGITFTVGTVSETSARLLALATLMYAAGTAFYASRAFRAGLEDRWSAALAAGVMTLLAWLLWQDGAQLIPAPFSVFLLTVVAAGIAITLTFTLGRYQEKIDRFRDQFGGRMVALLEEMVPEEQRAGWTDFMARFQPDPESKRKTPHLMMILFILFYAFIGYGALRLAWVALYGGGSHDEAGEGIANLFAATHAEPGTYLVAGHMFGLTLLLGLLYLIIPNELLRLRYPELSYPFKKTLQSVLRKKEAGLFGAHYYITATSPLAVLWLTRDSITWDRTIPAVMAVLAVTILADSASALIGSRYGRSKWFHNTDKSYIGSAAGTLTAFAVALPFVGIPVAIASAAVFLLVDIVGPIPIPVSDNILNPLALAATYTLMEPALAPMFPFY